MMIMVLVWSFDDVNDPDILAMIGSSAALAISSMPWKGPIGACRVGKVGDDLIINPTHEEREKGCLDLVMAATTSAITMVEAGADELSEEDMIEALFAGEEACEGWRKPKGCHCFVCRFDLNGGDAAKGKGLFVDDVY